MRLQARYWLGLQYPLPRWSRHTGVKLVLAVGSLHFPFTQAFPQGGLSVLMAWQLPFPRVLQETKAETEMPIMTWTWKSTTITSAVVYWTNRTALTLCGKRLYKAMNPRSPGSVGAILETDSHNLPPSFLPCLLCFSYVLASFSGRLFLSSDKDGHQHLQAHIISNLRGQKAFFPKGSGKSPKAGSDWPNLHMLIPKPKAVA